jgi:streptogramin lyase
VTVPLVIIVPSASLGSQFPFECVEGADGNMWAVSANTTGYVNKITNPGYAVTTYTATGLFETFCIASLGSDLYVGDLNGLWQCTLAGAITQVATISGVNLASVCVGPDGNFWAVCLGNDNIYKIDSSTYAVTSYTLSGASSPYVCSDGTDLWVSDQNSAIWRVTTGGTATNYSTTGYPTSICFDGTSIWCNSAGLGDIYKVDISTGGITTIPTPYGGGFAIQYRPADGYVWLADGVNIGSCYITRITTSGAVIDSTLLPQATPVGVNDIRFDTAGNPFICATDFSGNEDIWGFAQAPPPPATMQIIMVL